MFDGIVARLDTTASFTTASAWTSFDVSSIDSTAHGFSGSTFDGRYVYLIPNYSRLERLVVVMRRSRRRWESPLRRRSAFQRNVLGRGLRERDVPVGVDFTHAATFEIEQHGAEVLGLANRRDLGGRGGKIDQVTKRARRLVVFVGEKVRKETFVVHDPILSR